ncbi:hypothetical protein ABKN59_006700 [Abortiporus biennis]
MTDSQAKEREVVNVTPPEEEINGSDSKIPRKREREVSLEPSTPQATTIDLDAHAESHSKDRAPAKKNRVSAHLDPTEEEEDVAIADQDDNVPQSTIVTTNSGDRPSTPQESNNRLGEGSNVNLSCSPPIETKGTSERLQAAVDSTNEVEMAHPETDAEHGEEEKSKVPPIAFQGEKPPSAEETTGGDEHSGAADAGEVPPKAESPTVTPDEEEKEKSEEQVEGEPSSSSKSGSETSLPIPFPPTHAPPRSAPSPPPSSKEQIGLKRKLGDRTVSERGVPEERERPVKRATPPREEDETAETTKDEHEQASPKKAATTGKKESFVAPKFGGFMAYASTSSPFSTVKGPNIFSSAGASTSSSPFASTSKSTSLASPWSPSPKQGSSSFSLNNGNSKIPSTDDHSTASSSISSSPGQKRTGFEAFASTTSPFASAAKRPKSPPPFSHNTHTTSFHSTASASSSTNPFSSAASSSHGHGSLFGRSKSPSARTHSPAPVRLNAFSAYASSGSSGFASVGSSVFGGGAASSSSSFAGTTHKKDTSATESGSGEESEAGDKKEKVSFGERLRAGKDLEDGEDSGEEKKVTLTEQEIHTGEEDEETVYQVRGKLFFLSPQNQWKEKGTGMLKVNVKREDGSGARLLMRKEAVYTVILNAPLFKGMKCFLAQDPRYIRFSVFEGSSTTHYNLRVSNAKIAEDLLEEINSYIPTE